MTTYLLHLDGKLGRAQHYIGTSGNLPRRLKDHGTKAGARLLEVARQMGIGWTLARTWEGGRETEKRLKARKNAPKFCPICKAGREHDQGE